MLAAKWLIFEAAKHLLELLPAADVLQGPEDYDRPDPQTGRGQRHPPEHPAQGEPRLEKLLLARLYRARNAIERVFCRLQEFRRIATRYDLIATNFPSPSA
jgi:hypothetical protein